MQLAQPDDDFRAAYPRHDDVGRDHVDPVAMRRAYRECIGATGRREDRVALPSENLAPDSAECVLILDEQYGLATSRRLRDG